MILTEQKISPTNIKNIEEEGGQSAQLTKEEESTLDSAATIINSSPPYQDLQATRYQVGLIGNKALGYLKNKLKSEFEFSLFVDALAEIKDSKMVLDGLKVALQKIDGSASSHFMQTIQRLIFSIRSQNPQDPRLQEISHQLIEFKKTGSANPFSIKFLYIPIALTGTDEAKTFIKEETDQGNVDSYSAKKVQTYLTDLLNVSPYDVELGTHAKDILELKKQKLYEPILKKPLIENTKLWKKKTEVVEEQPEEESIDKPHIFRKTVKNINTENKPNTLVMGIKPAEVLPPDFVNLFSQLEQVYNEHPQTADYVRTAERLLGIESNLQRSLEAALFIDWKLFCTGAIAGNPSLEYMFGEKEWADWVTARLAAKSYGRNSLTVEFISFIHSCLSKRTNPDIGGGLRTAEVMGGDHTNPATPLTFTDEQIKAIEENPLLSFEQKGEDPRVGHIIYPAASSQVVVDSLSPETKVYFKEVPDNILPNTKKLVGCLLTDMCNWYNKERKKLHDPYKLAAELQQKLISIHPFKDANGRVSRLLMNWSLENDGVSPSILFDPNADIFSSAEEWSGEVKTGSEMFHAKEDKRKQLEAIGYNNVVELMGLSDLKTFYDLIYRQIARAPRIPKDGETIDQGAYEDFINQFQEEYRRFQREFCKTRGNDYSGRVINYPQGNLIPRSYLDLIALTPKDILAYQAYIRDNFFTDTIVYRGASSIREITEPDVVRMFEHYIGLGASYKALEEAYLDATSIGNINSRAIVSSLESYNQLMINSYFAKHHSDKISADPALSPQLATLIEVHKSAENLQKLSDSPFTSTSLSVDASKKWAQTNTFISNRKNGVFFTVKAPAFGGILAFGKGDTDRSDLPGLAGLFLRFSGEHELMLPGGINPCSIETLEVYGKDRNLVFTAKRDQTKDGVFLNITDIQNNLGRRYKLNPKTNRFELV